ncbi:hypothetical protein R5R35_007468 [Gryllus longicercus]|uniref:Uncharacterized protein n=1 Tax=Gryllus longicercus TaxID=2509291 RepID=A0AAN9YZQ4_9ORTH
MGEGPWARGRAAGAGPPGLQLLAAGAPAAEAAAAGALGVGVGGAGAAPGVAAGDDAPPPPPGCSREAGPAPTGVAALEASPATESANRGPLHTLVGNLDLQGARLTFSTFFRRCLTKIKMLVVRVPYERLIHNLINNTLVF